MSVQLGLSHSGEDANRRCRVYSSCKPRTSYGNKIFDRLGWHAALIGSYPPTFRDNLSVPSS